jgi:cytochrome oxidase Cu insertion factor (SCO1/SenC/PrrC family)
MNIRTAMFDVIVLFALTLGACAPQATSTPDAMMAHDTPTPDAMMAHDTPTADAMMPKPTSSPEAAAVFTPEASMPMAVWLGTPLVNAVSGQSFKISDFAGKVVLVETMAVWCSNCRRQQEQIQGLHQHMMEQTTDLISISLDIDPNEDSEILKKYVKATAFDWAFAVAPAELVRLIGETYGDQFLNPPATPALIIDRHGVAHPLPFGLKSAEDLMKAVQPYLDASM